MGKPMSMSRQQVFYVIHENTNKKKYTFPLLWDNEEENKT
jgi:hypothetical protein